MKGAAAVFLAGLAAVSLHAQTGARVGRDAAATVAAVVEQTGLTFRRSNEAVWIVTFKTAATPAIDVIVNAQKDLVVVFAVVARSPRLSSAQLRDLLKASYTANFAKLAIDHDGDLLSLTEIATDTLTAGQLRTAIEEVANTGDAAAELVRRHVPAEEDIENVPPGRGATLALVHGAFELAYDPAKWKLQPTDEQNIVQFAHVSGQAHLKVIAERLEIDPGNLAEAALSNAKSASPDVRIVTVSWRTLNGLRTVLVRLDGTSRGTRSSFYNQVYSDAAGTVQLAGWSGEAVFDEYRRDFLELFAGFRKRQPE